MKLLEEICGEDIIINRFNVSPVWNNYMFIITKYSKDLYFDEASLWSNFVTIYSIKDTDKIIRGHLISHRKIPYKIADYYVKFQKTDYEEYNTGKISKWDGQCITVITDKNGCVVFNRNASWDILSERLEIL